ncbi:hypothetical protein Bbelb_282550 [Branchiostoma belcheri]|nr:hypothetical protein Bbelb_282550 [Branchiostoma belcheri]
MENLQTFSWDDTVTWAEDLAPMSVGMLKALFPKRLKFVQAAMSVQLWRQGCPQNIFTTLNSLGICQSLKSARGPTDWYMESEAFHSLFEDTVVDVVSLRDIEDDSPEVGGEYSTRYSRDQKYYMEKVIEFSGSNRRAGGQAANHHAANHHAAGWTAPAAPAPLPGKDDRLPPEVRLPGGDHSESHWSNASTMDRYADKVPIPYVTAQREALGLSEDQPALAIFDVFKAHRCPELLAKLKENHIHAVFVPARCTGELQPLDYDGGVNDVLKKELKQRFVQHYADKFTTELQDGRDLASISVDMTLSKLKPIHANWVLGAMDSIANNVDAIARGWDRTGIRGAAGKTSCRKEAKPKSLPVVTSNFHRCDTEAWVAPDSPATPGWALDSPATPGWAPDSPATPGWALDSPATPAGRAQDNSATPGRPDTPATPAGRAPDSPATPAGRAPDNPAIPGRPDTPATPAGRAPDSPATPAGRAPDNPARKGTRLPSQPSRKGTRLPSQPSRQGTRQPSQEGHQTPQPAQQAGHQRDFTPECSEFTSNRGTQIFGKGKGDRELSYSNMARHQRACRRVWDPGEVTHEIVSFGFLFVSDIDSAEGMKEAATEHLQQVESRTRLTRGLPAKRDLTLDAAARIAETPRTIPVGERILLEPSERDRETGIQVMVDGEDFARISVMSDASHCWRKMPSLRAKPLSEVDKVFVQSAAKLKKQVKDLADKIDAAKFQVIEEARIPPPLFSAARLISALTCLEEQARESNHAEMEAPTPPSIDTHMKVDPVKLDHFIAFITSAHVVQDLPFGEKVLKLSSGESVKVPNTIRAMIPERIISQYQQYCAESHFVPMGKRTLLRVLDACKLCKDIAAGVTRVLQALLAFMRSFLWRTRCDCVFEKKQYSGSEMVDLFKTHLRDRLNFEFARLGPSGFLTVWADGFSWARVYLSLVSQAALKRETHTTLKEWRIRTEGMTWRITYDEDNWAEMKTALDDFFFDHFLPLIYSTSPRFQQYKKLWNETARDPATQRMTSGLCHYSSTIIYPIKLEYLSTLHSSGNRPGQKIRACYVMSITTDEARVATHEEVTSPGLDLTYVKHFGKINKPLVHALEERTLFILEMEKWDICRSTQPRRTHKPESQLKSTEYMQQLETIQAGIPELEAAPTEVALISSQEEKRQPTQNGKGKGRGKAKGKEKRKRKEDGSHFEMDGQLHFKVGQTKGWPKALAASVTAGTTSATAGTTTSATAGTTTSVTAGTTSATAGTTSLLVPPQVSLLVHQKCHCWYHHKCHCWYHHKCHCWYHHKCHYWYHHKCHCWYHHKCIPVPESEKWEELTFVCRAQDKTAVHRTVLNITLHERQKRHDRVQLLQGTVLPESGTTARQPLMTPLTKPSQPLTHGHKLLVFNEPENREGQHEKRPSSLAAPLMRVSPQLLTKESGVVARQQ